MTRRVSWCLISAVFWVLGVLTGYVNRPPLFDVTEPPCVSTAYVITTEPHPCQGNLVIGKSEVGPIAKCECGGLTLVH